MRARLFCPTGELKGADYEIEGSASIGRAAGNTIRLRLDPVSKQHARIWFDEERGSFYLEDRGSRNGTELDGVPVTGGERLGDLHVISFAGVDFLFQRLAGAPPPGEGVSEVTSVEGEVPTLPLSLSEIAEGAAEPAGIDQTRVERDPVTAPASLVGGAEPAASPEAGAAGAPGARRTVYLELTGRGEPPPRYPLAEGENSLGRSSRAAVSINTPELSRRHAVIIVEGDRVWVEDRGSRNHTYCAGQRVSERVEVPPGAPLRFANLDARIVVEAAAR